MAGPDERGAGAPSDLRSAVLARLGALAGPDGRTPLPASGALSDVVVHEGKAYLSIAVDPRRAAEFEPLRRAAEAAVLAVPGVNGAVVALTAERAPGAAAAGPAASERVVTAPAAGIGRVRHVVAVASGKGGVGKSTTACNLALGLRSLGLKVGVLDADIYGPSMPKLFALKGKPKVRDGRILQPLEGYGCKVMSIGFLVEESVAMVWRGPMVISALNQMLKEVDWGELDVLVVDMPPGTGDAQLTMSQTVPLAGAVIVSTPQDLALIDARRGVTMFQKVDVPILGLVENMSYFVCPHCGGRSDIFGHGGAQDEAARLGVPFLGGVPLSLDIRETSDAGLPLTVTDPDGPHAQTYTAIARALWRTLESGAARKPAPRIVME